MTVIRPNSISGVTSITAQVSDISIFSASSGFANITAGNISAAGTITYEDVTNIDSVGVVTARTGIKIGPSAGVAGTFFADGSYVTAGVITATTFHGSGANLTSLPAQATIANNADNRIITGGSGVNLNGESNALIDSSGRILVGTTASRTVWGNHNVLQVEGLGGGANGVSITRNTNDVYYPYLAFGKSRGTSDGSSTIVANNDVTGVISFNGADGGDMNPQTAYIQSAVDGTPGVNDMPGRLQFFTTADGAADSTERLRIDSSGTIQIKGDGGNNNKIYGYDGASLAWILGNNNSDDPEFTNFRAGNLLFKVNGAEKVRINNSGQVLIGTTNASSGNGVGIKLNYGSTNPTVNTVINQSAGNHSFYHLYNMNASHNGYRFYVMTNGGIANHSGNNSNLSDERMKKNISNMGSVYNTFKQFEFKDFNYISDGSSDIKKHGVIAQDVEKIDSNLITEDFKIDQDSDGNDVYRKALKEEQFMMIGLKALQEAITKIETLEAKVAALEGS